jgi:hypothetical protein
MHIPSYLEVFMLKLTDLATRKMLDAALAAVGAAGWMNAASLILFTNEILPAHDTLYGDLEQPTYAGYAAKDVLWGAPYMRPGDRAWCVSSQLAQWQMGDDLVPTVVVGFGICLKAAPNTLWALELLPSPKQLLSPDDAVLFTAEVAIGDNRADYGEADQIVP